MLIGLNGKLRSGKDTVYQRIVARGSKAERIAFADKLKQSAAAALGCDVGTLEAMKNSTESSVSIQGFDENGECWLELTPRRFLQYYGTEAHREIFGADFWVDATLPLNCDHDYEFYVVTDVRFPNEIERIKTLGGYMWKVIGPNDKSDGHASEQDFPDDMFDLIIDNTVRDDNFANLDRQIEAVLLDYVYG